MAEGMHPDEIPRWCDTCRVFDLHPRHIRIDQLDPLLVTSKHMDCCRNDGCWNGHCDAVMRDSGGAHGTALHEWLKAEMVAGRR